MKSLLTSMIARNESEPYASTVLGVREVIQELLDLDTGMRRKLEEIPRRGGSGGGGSSSSHGGSHESREVQRGDEQHSSGSRGSEHSSTSRGTLLVPPRKGREREGPRAGEQGEGARGDHDLGSSDEEHKDHHPVPKKRADEIGTGDSIVGTGDPPAAVHGDERTAVGGSPVVQREGSPVEQKLLALPPRAVAVQPPENSFMELEELVQPPENSFMEELVSSS